MLAMHSCTTKEIAAVTGQSDQMVSYYTKGVNQAELAEKAVTKVEQNWYGVTARMVQGVDFVSYSVPQTFPASGYRNRH